ncbi:MAG: hypothetical protein Q7T51_03345 [Candidatus Moranbacteria bacterium]|nr:hypothetical protein [Candidatus Moranbacteria bacterium]
MTMDTNKNQQKEFSNIFPITSLVLPDHTLFEMLYDQDNRQTNFIKWKAGETEVAHSFKLEEDWKIVPYRPENPLLHQRIILFPTETQEYSDDETLIREIQSFIHRYVDVSETFELVAVYYVLLTWIYDTFNEIPYLRVRGDYGSGKTRFLQTVGSICYKPIFASGASTVAPLFHILDQVGGTLILDEGDFRFSDERADIAKILNNGNAKGFPVLRCEKINQREFAPRAYTIYGPKIVASRHDYDDFALESRFITEDVGLAGVRDDIPITLPIIFQHEAQELRNKLLLWRFHNFSRQRFPEAHVDPKIDKRISQIFAPLLSLVSDQDIRAKIARLARDKSDEIRSDRGFQKEADVLMAIRACLKDEPMTISAITQTFTKQSGFNYERQITPKWIGSVIRKKLRLRTRKKNGIYVLGENQKEKLKLLFKKYNL